MNRYIIFIASLLMSLSAFGQNSAKLKQQKTLFFYTQFNLHGGYVFEPTRQGFSLPTRGPDNQVAFQVSSRNKRRIIQGYTPLVSLAGWKARVSMRYRERFSDASGQSGFAQLVLRDMWMKFATRWDRTSFTIGYKSIPFGHNPKLDPVSSFMSNIVVTNLGISQDLGVFFRTAASSKLDLELSLTSGGLLNHALMQYGNFRAGPNPELSLIDLKYSGTWLVTGRLGQQPFRKNELGLIAVAGYIPCFFIENDFQKTIHVGGDWILKHRERLKMTNQLVFGVNNTTTEGSFANLSAQNNIDIFLFGKFILGFFQSLNINRAFDFSQLFFKYLTANSFAWVISPHTRLRLNHYFTLRNYGGEASSGFMLQFVTGIGKR